MLMIVILKIIGLAIFWVFITWIMTKSFLIAWMTYFCIPMILSFFWWGWQKNTINAWFVWAKTYTMIFSISWMLLLRNGQITNMKYGRLVSEICLMANIIEAIITNILGNDFPRWINIMTGILLLITLPRGSNKIWIENKNSYWNIPYSWLLGYTLWNICFIYLEFPHVFYDHLSLLIAAGFISLLYQRELWVQARGFTLGLFIIGRQINSNYFHIDRPRINDSNISILLSLLGLCWMMLCIGGYFNRIEGIIHSKE